MKIELKSIESFPKLISIISLFLLLGSLWFEGLYYSTFGINIFSYISISEAINLFIDKLPLMILISCGAFFIFFLFQLIFEERLIKLFHWARYNRRMRGLRFAQVNLINTIIFLIPFMLFAAIIPSWFVGSFKTEEFLLIRAFIVLFNIF